LTVSLSRLRGDYNSFKRVGKVLDEYMDEYHISLYMINAF